MTSHGGKSIIARSVGGSTTLTNKSPSMRRTSNMPSSGWTDRACWRLWRLPREPSNAMVNCQECGDEVLRRIKCGECGRKVCPTCFHHGFHTRKQREESDGLRREVGVKAGGR